MNHCPNCSGDEVRWERARPPASAENPSPPHTWWFMCLRCHHREKIRDDEKDFADRLRRWQG